MNQVNKNYINGKWQGALTASLTIALTSDPYRSWNDVHQDIITMLKGADFDQNPRLSGSSTLTAERTILGGKS